MIELYIDSVRISLRHYQRVLVLKQEDTQKYLPIWIGADIAEAIVLSLQNIDLPRPLTHDLMNNLIIQMGGKVDSIIVSKLEHDTYFAQIKIEYNNEIFKIDSRPSDAIALSVRTNAPIFVDASVFEKASIDIDLENNVILKHGNLDSNQPSVSKEELKKLSAFQDFVSGLDMNDLEEKKKD